MKVNNGVLPVIPVRSNVEVPKTRVFDAVKLVSETSIDAPVKMGQIIIKNLLGIEGINVIASRDMKKKK
jgi:CxxC motif-containing protein